MRRAAALLLLALSACGGDDGASAAVPVNDFCARMVAAGCDREVPCGMYADRATCTATLTDLLDGCPLAVNAVAMQEADYDGAAAARFLDAVRTDACASDLPDLVTEFPVFTPKLGAGAVCHSDFSCTTGLTCDNLTIADPQGICTAI